MENIWSYIFSALGGGTIIGVLSWTINNRKDKRVGLTTIIDNYNLDNQRLRKDVDELREMLKKEQQERYDQETKLREEIQKLRTNLMVMESAHLDLPIPQWLKDKDGVMLALNEPFERVFLEPMGMTAQDYIGKTDAEIWPEGNSEQFSRSDSIVARTNKPYQFIETVKYEDRIEQWEVLKYPRFAGRINIGTAGIAFKRLKDNTTPART